MLWRGIMGFTKFGDKRVNDLALLSGLQLELHATREAPTASPKSLPISGAENEPSGHGEVLLL